MSDDLVKRLRDEAMTAFGEGLRHGSADYSLSGAICDEAADRIEELEAKLARAVEALERSAQEHRVIAGMNMIAASATAYNAAREAEATIEELKGGDQ